MRTYYQVFANSVYGSDVLEFDQQGEAIKAAKDWQKECDKEIVILKCTEEEIKWQELK